MRLLQRVKNKTILGAILALLMTFITVTPSYTEQIIVQQEQSMEAIELTSVESYNASDIKIKGTRIRVGATAYCGDTITSTGTVPIEGTTIAVDPTIIPYGSKVYIPKFNRVFIAEDCGSAIKGYRIDIFMNSYSRCMEWGFRDIDIYILNN